MRVDVYRNLKKDTFSIRHRGIVTAHKEIVTIVNPSFVIQPSGAKKALDTQQRNVHAFVRGELSESNDTYDLENMISVTYNPFNQLGWVDEDGESIDSALLAYLINGKAYVIRSK
jgi:hypothetical protein